MGRRGPRDGPGHQVLPGAAGHPAGAQRAAASARRREDYIGPWLPEPLLLDVRDGAADVVLVESVSMAMLVPLQTLGSDERAVFVLREVFDVDYGEIAAAVGTSEATVRQVAHRAREHVRARRRRFEPVDATRSAQITQRFMTAAATGDMTELLAMLAPEATWTADSGDKATAARHPVTGADKVAAIVIGLFRTGPRLMPDLRLTTVTCNSAPAVIAHTADRLEGVFLFEIVDRKKFFITRQSVAEVGFGH